ncbi:PepSY-associated TM helix domain-containing protein [Undibacterium pigrum]|uniref:Putative iron-regulated membrane protein n=1 Tax=Undibacterium pigrum TaxID=401470 RepID=A0A318JAD5_9BURK|nr:PepSY domain-containing protein [Undibacterium pigrum]PXX43767.1 putative iron-regulated membrane protein [Undibacterium pigrum]
MSNLDIQHANKSALLHRVFWRLHFWSGLLTAPIVLFAALTGILYIFTPQIEAWKHAELDKVAQIRAALPLDQQVDAAMTAFPGKQIKSIVPAYVEGETTQVIFGEQRQREKKTANTENSKPNGYEEHQGHQMPEASKAAKVEGIEHSAGSENLIVYVDPGTARIQGSILESGRFRNWARKLHSNMLQGDGWRWIIELGASWMLMMMITGIYLWWPRGKASWRSVLQYSGNNRRVTWRYLHSMLSIVLGLVTLIILLTGLTWAKYAGENFRIVQNAAAQNTPRAPKDLKSVVAINGNSALSIQAVYQQAKNQASDVQMQLTPPKSESGVWKIDNYDRSQPGKRFQLILDAYSGNTLFQSGWEQMPVLSRATAVGIPFHRGEFGLWNQALLVLVGLNVIFSVVSGYVMWLQRRKAGSLSAPKLESKHMRVISWWMWVITLALGVAMPVFGISLLILLLMEVTYLYFQIN